MEICLQVVQIILILNFSIGLLFLFLFGCIKYVYFSISLVYESTTALDRYRGNSSYSTFLALSPAVSPLEVEFRDEV